jgi:hypothetical protein
MKMILPLIVMLVLISSADAAEYNLSKIKSCADNYNCTPLWENPKIGPRVAPWYSDISSLTGREGDFVFMCELKSEPGIFRVVIAADSNRTIWKGCPSHIDIRGVFPYPSGLAVHTSKDPDYFHLRLSEWHYEYGENGPNGVMPTGPIIDTSDNVAGDLFYCYEGKWLRLFVD